MRSLVGLNARRFQGDTVSVRNGNKFVPLEFERLDPAEQVKRAREFEMRMQTGVRYGSFHHNQLNAS
jgi:hypothetical protein